MGQSVAQLIEALRHKTGGPGFDSRRSPWTFSSELILLSAFSSSGVHSSSNRNEDQGFSFGGKVRPERTADNSTVLVVPNVKVRMEAQRSILPSESL